LSSRRRILASASLASENLELRDGVLEISSTTGMASPRLGYRQAGHLHYPLLRPCPTPRRTLAGSSSSPGCKPAGWDDAPHSIAEQRTITDGRIVPLGKSFVRKPSRRVDYILRYERNFPLAVVEAKGSWRTAGDGLQQPKGYAEMLGLSFAYATNGQEIVEFDYFTGRETVVATYPTPADLWARYRAGAGLTDPMASRLLTPMNHSVAKGERYYQEIAVNRAVAGILTPIRK
jgi:type I restriction enzyme, R subunit